MPVPLSLISVLNSVSNSNSKGFDGSQDSFENWPNGTDTAPEGWTVVNLSGFGYVKQGTFGVTDGSFSVYMSSAGFAFTDFTAIQKSFDLSGFSLIELDYDINSGFGKIVINSSTIDTAAEGATGTMSGDISGFTGTHDVRIEHTNDPNSSYPTGSGSYDNLRLS